MRILKALNVRNPLFLYGVSILAIAAIFIVLEAALPKTIFENHKILSFAYSFLFRCWPIQILNSWLFLVGLVYWVQRYSRFRGEEEAFRRIVLPEYSIPRVRAGELIESMPDQYRRTLTLRRFREILQTFIYGEDVIRLNEELSRRDMEEVERGHLVLDSLRSIIPIIGFLGTVIGLSLGMIKFPDVADPAAMRAALKGFAASLSVAFDTTLLALGYTVVMVLLTSFLRQGEEVLVSKVDERARMLIGKIKFEAVPEQTQPGEDGSEPLNQIRDLMAGWKADFASQMQDFAKEIYSHNGRFAGEVRKAMEEAGRTLVSMFEQVRDAVHNPPAYQIVVQPIKEERNEE